MKKLKMKHISDNGEELIFESKEVKLLDYNALIKTKFENKTDLIFKICTDDVTLNNRNIKKRKRF